MTTQEAFEAWLKAQKEEQVASDKAGLAYSVYAQTKATNQD
jgi:hypothetical protein